MYFFLSTFFVKLEKKECQRILHARNIITRIQKGRINLKQLFKGDETLIKKTI